MDLKMPIMDGIEATEKIMEDMPTPIIVVSSLDVSVIVKALGAGAMDFVAITQEIEEIARDLAEKIKIASRVKPLRRLKIAAHPKRIYVSKRDASKVIAVGVSTGGPQALQALFSSLPPSINAGILVVQHIAKGFIAGLVQWLKGCSALDIKVAESGDILKSGIALFAPDDYNLFIEEGGRIGLKEDTTKKMLHVPSIDEMMKSAADIYENRAVGVIMTGMGRDGMEGMRAIKKKGGKTIAQNEKTSVVFGMNKAAIDLGCVDVVLPLEKIAEEIVRSV
jgi:two-component system chemotaxis response regulator CheB